MPIDELKLKKTHSKAKSLATLMLPVPIIIALLGEVLLKDLAPEFPASIYTTLQYVLTALTALEIILMIVFKNMILSGSLTLIALPRHTEQSEEDIFLNRLFSSFLITYSLCISISIYGLVLQVLGNDNSLFFGFIGASFFLMVVQFPKLDEWETRLKHYVD